MNDSPPRRDPLTLARGTRLPGTLVGGLAILLVVLVGALLGPLVIVGDPTALHLDAALQAPSAAHPFGTDNYGRDVLLRVLYGARIDFLIGLLSVLPSFVIGTVIGSVAGYCGNWLDAVIMRVVDVVIAFPFLVIVIAIVALLGPGLKDMFIAIAGVGWVGYARLVRSEVMVGVRFDYVLAARTLGASESRILVRHLLPNVVVQPVIYSTTHFVGYILLGSALGYLGLGVQPPTPEWGVMIADGRNFLLDAPQMTIFPGLAILVISTAFLLLGDGLADFLRPEV